MVDEDEDDLEIVSVAQNLYSRLFAPDSILVRDDDSSQQQEVSFG